MCCCSILSSQTQGNHTQDFEEDYVIQGVDNGAETKMEGPTFRSHTARCSQSKDPHRAQLEVEKVED